MDNISVDVLVPRLMTQREQTFARKMLYYTDGLRRLVQIDASVFVIVSDHTDMQEEAKKLMEEVRCSPPDMQCHVMDDGCPLVMMQGAVCAVSDVKLPPDTKNVPFETALPMREMIRASCEKQECLALLIPDHK